MSSKTKDTSMTATAQHALVPKLRFPEFRDAGEWAIDLLGNRTISNFIDERVTLDKLKLESYVSTENFLPYYAGVTRATKLPTSGSFTRYKKDDVLISNIRPYLKKVWSADKEGASSNDVIVIRAGERIARNFLVFVLKNDQFIHYVMAGAKGVKMPRGDISSMKEYPVAFPKDDEQQKIADCLSSIDDLITLEARKIDALKAHKKGLMQQLFPAEGETLPKLRFPEFRDAGEWEEKLLGELGKIVTGKTPSTTDKSLWGGKTQFVTPTDMNEEKYQTKTQRTVANSPKLTILPPKTIMFTCIASIGKMSLSVLPCVTNQQINSIIPHKGFDNEYIYYALLMASSQIKSKLASTTLPIINKTEFSQIAIFIPFKEEQQKIADCLSSIDDMIALQAKKLDTLKIHKKGLMQQLFPSLVEVRD